MRILLLLACLPVAAAVSFPANERAQVDAMLALLDRSGCEFYRNGQWYGGRAARDHLQMKFDYLVQKGWIHNTQEFIEGAATKSSFSGEPYRVRCPGQAAKPSAVWLRERLAEMTRVRQDAAP